MPGPEALKAKCFQCHVNKWCTDFREGCAANISKTSVCMSCLHDKKLETLERKLTGKDAGFEKLIARVEALEGEIGGRNDRVAALERELELKDIELKKVLKDLQELRKGKEEEERRVNSLSKIIEENINIITESGRDIVEIRKKISDSKNDYNFQEVIKNKAAKPRKSAKSCGIPLANRFSILEQEETYLLGDSIVKGQEDYFANKNKRRRKVKSFSGCKTSKVIEEVKKLKLPSRDSCVIAHVGSNDLYLSKNKTGNSEPLVKDLECLVDTVKDKTNKGMIVGILPRCNVSYHALSKAIGVNERIRKYCHKKDVRFLDPWDEYVGKKYYFKTDGVHLNRAGTVKLEDILSRSCENMLSNCASCCDTDVSVRELPTDLAIETNVEENVMPDFEGFIKEN